MGDASRERKLGRYQIIKHLASGGMAQVLLARASGIEGFTRHVVIKQIHVERARDENVVKMFLDEARLAASLHHANIVQVHDIGQEKGEYFIAMEYVHGEDLRALLHKLSSTQQQLPIEHVITIVSSAAAALHYAHEQRGPDRAPLGLVHRDVSPANILVGYDGNVKVVDFGIAKAAHRSTETHSGTLKGKISYMAPEQCMGLEVDRRSDVFALGIVLYELYTVRRLFKASSDFLTMTQIASGQIPTPRLHRQEIPVELEQIILKALARHPTDRYQSAEEMRVALDRFAAKAGLRTSTTALADYMIEQFGRRPEPWTVDDDDDDEAEIAVLDVDFDGAPSQPTEALDESSLPPGIPTPVPGSLLAKARRKQKQRLLTATPMPEVSDDSPTTASGTPMAWMPTPMPTAPPRKRWPVVVVTVGGCLAIAAGFLLFAGSGSSTEHASQPAAAPTFATPPPPPAPPPPSPPAATVEPTVSTPTVPTPTVPTPTVPAPTIPTEPAIKPTHVVTRPVHHAAKPAPKPADASPVATPAEYDPDSLFIKKKP